MNECTDPKGHKWFQLLSLAAGWQGGSSSQPDRKYETVKEVAQEPREVYTYPFLLCCRYCAEIIKVTYRDG